MPVRKKTRRGGIPGVAGVSGIAKSAPQARANQVRQNTNAAARVAVKKKARVKKKAASSSGQERSLKTPMQRRRKQLRGKR